MRPHIGLDIGGTSLKSAVVTATGEVLARRVTPLDIARPDWIDAVPRQLAALEKEFGTAAGVGVAAPGIARPDGSGIGWMQGRLAELERVDFTTLLAGASRPSAAHASGSFAVPVLNDAQAALLGEAWLGAAAGQDNVALLTLGTGVGGAAMVDGRLLRGAIGRAGHLGHISLDPAGVPDITNCPGSLEEAVGNCSVHRRTNGRFDSVLSLAAAAQAGDVDAARWWDASVCALAAGVASIVNVLDPETVIIGGGIAAAGDALFVPLARWLDAMEWRPHGHRVRIVRAALGEHAGAIGAARNGMMNEAGK